MLLFYAHHCKKQQSITETKILIAHLSNIVSSSCKPQSLIVAANNKVAREPTDKQLITTAVAGKPQH